MANALLKKRAAKKQRQLKENYVGLRVWRYGGAGEYKVVRGNVRDIKVETELPQKAWALVHFENPLFNWTDSQSKQTIPLWVGLDTLR